MSDKMIIVDVSHWNTVNYQELYDGGVRVVIVKISQGTIYVDRKAEQHIADARAVGMLVGGYHWADPTQNDQQQINLIIDLMNKYELKFIAIDVEQYWADWGEWQQGNITKIVSGDRINQNAWNLSQAMVQAGFHTSVYTRASFIDAYAPKMWNWIRDMKGWYAQYPYAGGRINLTWDEFRAGHEPRIPWPGRTSKLNGQWEEIPDWYLWQFSGDKFILPGTGGLPIDLNYAANDDDIIRLLGGSTTPEPEPLPEPEPGQCDIRLTVIRDLNIRDKPTTSGLTVGLRKPLEIVQVTELSIERADRIWVKDKRGWSAMVHNGIQFMR